MSGRNAQVSRIYRILDLLEAAPQGLTVGEVWQRVQDCGHEVSKRTVYRDLDALSSAGFPLFPEGQGDASRWKLERKARVTQFLVLSARELFALYLAREALAPLQHTAFYRDLVIAFSKIEAKLGSASRAYFDSLKDEVRYEPAPKLGLGLDPDLLDTVRAASAEGQVLEVRYRSVSSGGKERLRRLGVHFLYFAKGGIYLVAEDLETSEVKVFSLARMSQAEMSDEAYTGTPVDPEKYFEASIGVFRGKEAEKVELIFSPPVANHVRERQWHSSQEAVLMSGGRVRISLNVAITPELVQWVLSFGSSVEIVEPAQLRTQVVRAAQQVLDLYKGKAA